MCLTQRGEVMILLFPHLLSSLTPYTGPWVLGTLQEAMLELR